MQLNIDDIYKQSNSLPFWRDYQNKFPALSLLARRLFSIPVAAAAVEWQFSAAGLTITQRRCCLDLDTVNNVLFVRSIQNILNQKPGFLSK